MRFQPSQSGNAAVRSPGLLNKKTLAADAMWQEIVQPQPQNRRPGSAGGPANPAAPLYSPVNSQTAPISDRGGALPGRAGAASPDVRPQETAPPLPRAV